VCPQPTKHSFCRLYSDLGFTFKETLNSHIRSLGKDPEKIWSDIEDVIRSAEWSDT
jgi:hypothetical protein